ATALEIHFPIGKVGPDSRGAAACASSPARKRGQSTLAFRASCPNSTDPKKSGQVHAAADASGPPLHPVGDGAPPAADVIEGQGVAVPYRHCLEGNREAPSRVDRHGRAPTVIA